MEATVATSTFELIGIGQDIAATLAHLSAFERVVVASVLAGIVLGEFPENEQRARSEAACADITKAIRFAAQHNVRP
jgi:hypothetical protein